MYALANVEKFLADKRRRISPQKRAAVLRRARTLAKPDGIILAGMSGDLWRDEALERRFGHALTHNVAQMEVSMAAIRAARNG